MTIRNARVSDAGQIHAIISEFAGMDRMLFRSFSSIYENIQTFSVATDKSGEVVGCVALSVMWADLAEVKSLAVSEKASGKGVGGLLVNKAVDDAKRLGISKVFALTLEPVFFEKVGFKRIDKEQLPMKVWSDCADCPKQDHCDEIAMIIDCDITELKS